MDMKQTEGAIEAILFAAGDPIELARIAQALALDEKTCETILAKMIDEFSFDRRGVKILRLGSCYQLCTRPEYAEYVKTALDNRREATLSCASLEGLAIVAYNQPVTRGYIEQLRGVDSASTVATLLERELIEERGRLDMPGHPKLYGTTSTFLRCFGISSLEELPGLTDTLEGQESLLDGERSENE